VPVIPKAKDREAVLLQAHSMRDSLLAAGIRVRLDDSEGNTPGWKFNFWEMKGVPIRLEVGPRDVSKQACVLSRRDRPGKDGKVFGVPIEAEALVTRVRAAMAEVQVCAFSHAESVLSYVYPLLAPSFVPNNIS
jgi:prolyl-tRNA synthetase